jgi:thioester reductase-like protein
MQSLNIFHHISTYAVIGGLNGELSEDEMDKAENFQDFYAKSKMQGENILRNTDLDGVKKRIYRPGIVTGSTKSGDIEKVDGPYYLMKFLYEQKDLLKNLKYIKKFPLPFNDKSYLPLIPVDYLADWIEYAVLNPSKHEDRSYNFFGENPVTIKEFTRYLLKSYGIDAEPMEFKELGLYKYTSNTWNAKGASAIHVLRGLLQSR